jgi:hypothetical protein
MVFSFCKTAQKPYDICVVCALTLAKHYFKKDIKVSSDGDAKDWEMGVKLVNDTFGYKMKVEDGKDEKGYIYLHLFEVEEPLASVKDVKKIFGEAVKI